MLEGCDHAMQKGAQKGRKRERECDRGMKLGFPAIIYISLLKSQVGIIGTSSNLKSPTWSI